MAERSVSATGSPTEDTPDTIQLINVVVVREGEMVSSRWGIHPQLKRDLAPAEWQELNEHMNRVVALVGSKFADQLSKHEGNTSAHGSA
jgi:hypothetical protein